MWNFILYLLAVLSLDAQTASQEPAKAEAAVLAAYSALCRELPPEVEPEPQPGPEPGECCGECGGTGKLKMPDGHLIDCPCPPGCACKTSKEEKESIVCKDGKCYVR